MTYENSQTFNVATARQNLSEILNLAKYKNTRIEITKRNKPVAYLISAEDFELLEKIEDYLDAKEADFILKNSTGTISHDELFNDLGLD